MTSTVIDALTDESSDLNDRRAGLLRRLQQRFLRRHQTAIDGAPPAVPAPSNQAPAGRAEHADDNGAVERAGPLRRLRQRLRLRRLRRRLRPRALRRLLRKTSFNEAQLDQLLRAQRQLETLRATLDDHHRTLQWSLLAVTLDPQLERDQAMRDVRQLTRQLDERAAELIMSLVEFGNSLDDAQRLTLKRWLARG